jgi:hypothetical protein
LTLGKPNADHEETSMMRFFRALLGRSKISAALALAIAFGSLGTALAMSSGGPADPPDGTPMQFAPAVGDIPVVPGPPATVVRTIAARLPLVANARVVSETIPVSDTGETAAVPVLEYDLLVPGFTGSEITAALWQANLLAGAVVDEFRVRGFGTIAEAHGTLVTPDGRRQAIGGGVGRAAPNQLFNVVPGSIGATIATAASRFGLRSTRASILSALQPVVVVHATTDTPANSISALARAGGLSALLGGSPARFEGVYLEVQDGSGAPVYISATAPRAAATTLWVKPGLGIQPRGKLRLPPTAAD